MPELPAGTLTVLHTDVEESTPLTVYLGDRYPEVLATHRILLRAAFAHEGHEVDTQGDSFFVVFPRATQAVAAAVASQRALAAEAWPEGGAVRVRIGMHTGEPIRAAEGYTGLDVIRGARIKEAGHGGQVLLSKSTAALIEDALIDAQSLWTRERTASHSGAREAAAVFQPEVRCALATPQTRRSPRVRRRGRKCHVPASSCTEPRAGADGSPRGLGGRGAVRR
jgi:class 3 adenylate cyclase